MKTVPTTKLFALSASFRGTLSPCPSSCWNRDQSEPCGRAGTRTSGRFPSLGWRAAKREERTRGFRSNRSPSWPTTHSATRHWGESARNVRPHSETRFPHRNGGRWAFPHPSWRRGSWRSPTGSNSGSDYNRGPHEVHICAEAGHRGGDWESLQKCLG